MKTILVEQFGQDHWMALCYIDHRCIDHGGTLALDELRCNAKIHPEYAAEFAHLTSWHPDYNTTLKDGIQIEGHDDWHCVDDLMKARLVENITKNNKAKAKNHGFRLTDLGNDLVRQIRIHKQNGGTFSNFEYKAT
jgi:hypothetical protein